MLRLALGLLLLVACSVSSKAFFDDRYFDSRKAVSQKVVKHRAKSRHIGRPRHVQVQRQVRHTSHFRYRRISWQHARADAQIVGGRPAGCPPRFCGCGASLEVFGRIIPALNLAANWLKFPRTQPAPGMVAARRGHVWVLVRHIQGNVWLGHDSNSGRHLTRIHPRSIAGYAIVNPRATL